MEALGKSFTYTKNPCLHPYLPSYTHCRRIRQVSLQETFENLVSMSHSGSARIGRNIPDKLPETFGRIRDWFRLRGQTHGFRNDSEQLGIFRVSGIFQIHFRTADFQQKTASFLWTYKYGTPSSRKGTTTFSTSPTLFLRFISLDLSFSLYPLNHLVPSRI